MGRSCWKLFLDFICICTFLLSNYFMLDLDLFEYITLKVQIGELKFCLNFAYLSVIENLICKSNTYFKFSIYNFISCLIQPYFIELCIWSTGHAWQRFQQHSPYLDPIFWLGFLVDYSRFYWCIFGLLPVRCSLLRLSLNLKLVHLWSIFLCLLTSRNKDKKCSEWKSIELSTKLANALSLNLIIL